MKNFYLVIFLSFIVSCTFAQSDSTGSFKAIVISDNHKPLSNATVMLLSQKDSQLIKIQVSDADGIAMFSDVHAGNYFVKANHVGYKNFISANAVLIESSKASDYTIQMDTLGNQLEDVTVQSHKQFIQLGTNKTIINMDASQTNIGTTVLEALEKLPGVMIDRNGTVSLKNKAGVMILIDGKQTYLSGSDLIAYLNGLSSDQVSTIEIEEHPSSKYDAQGNAGVINIKTKKSNRQGVFGSFTPSFAQGK